MSRELIPPHFGLNLMRLRESREMTVAEACFTLHIRIHHWDAWEKGRSFPGINNILRICNLFGYHNIYTMCTEPINFKTRLEAAKSNVA